MDRDVARLIESKIEDINTTLSLIATGVTAPADSRSVPDEDMRSTEEPAEDPAEEPKTRTKK